MRKFILVIVPVVTILIYGVDDGKKVKWKYGHWQNEQFHGIMIEASLMPKRLKELGVVMYTQFN